MKHSQSHFFSALLFLSALACNTTKQTELIPTNPEPILLPFQDCADTQSYLADVVLNQVLSYKYGNYGWGIMDAESDASADNGSTESGPSDYTTTNTQEEGVDEIDLVKTDGQYIYVAQDRALHIVDSWPIEDASKVASLEFDGWSNGIFLNGDTIILSTQVYDSDFYGTRFEFIDITDRSNPTITRSIDISGYQADARMIENDLYFVLNHWLDLPTEAWELAWDDSLGLPEVDWNLEGDALDADIESKRLQASIILEPMIGTMVQEWDPNLIFPLWRDSDGIGEFIPMYNCDEVYHPAAIAQYNMLSLMHVDLDANTVDNTGLMSNGWTIYASQDNLYVAQSSRWWWWGWGDLSLDTHIHKFALNAGTGPEYVASGAVSGWIYDQFAMSEFDGHLRVASTEIDWWWWSNTDEDAGNNVTILQDDGAGLLQETGSVTGIAPGEQIRAVRMMGEKGYVVTFEQTDPLFTIDLSDHSNPIVVGELIIPGFSTYLHPVGADHLLSVGMAGEMDGTITGMAINIFDVSDFANPQLTHQFEITDQDSGWSWSEALWEHHAFTFHRDVLTIPAYRSSYIIDEDGNYDYNYFSGTLAFGIDLEEGILDIGEVDHHPLVEESECLYSLYYDYEDSVCDDWGWYANVRRNVYIEDNLFSISNYGIRINDLNDPSISIKDILFYPALQ